MKQIEEKLIKAVKEVRTNMHSIQNELGKIALLEARKHELIQAYKEQETALNKVSETIREQYGDGEVDLESGTFSPAE